MRTRLLFCLVCLMSLYCSVANAQSSQRFWVVEIQPSYPGGEAEMMKFIRTNLDIPKVLDEEDWWGTAYVEFTVETDGSLTDLGVYKKLHPAADSAAIAMVKKMPKWNPGKMAGKVVATRVAIPVKFRHSSIPRKRHWWALFN